MAEIEGPGEAARARVAEVARVAERLNRVVGASSDGGVAVEVTAGGALTLLRLDDEALADGPDRAAEAIVRVVDAARADAEAQVRRFVAGLGETVEAFDRLSAMLADSGARGTQR